MNRVNLSCSLAACSVLVGVWTACSGPPRPETGVIRLEIERVESPTFEGEAFGDVGPYEKLVGRFHAELDPADRRNTIITDIDKAPRNEKGHVEYSADFYILKPLDMTKGNGRILYEFGNRGNKPLLSTYNDSAGGSDPTSAEDAGNGFLMRRGYTLVWGGILADVKPGNDRLTLQVPVAQNPDGSPIEGTIWDECMFFEEGGLRCELSYPVPQVDPSVATLLVRERRSEDPVELPQTHWTFDGPGAIQLLPDGTPFKKGFIYQFIHQAANPPVMGIGLAAARDFVSFLRHQTEDAVGTANPLGGIDKALSYGVSQTGRFEREFVYLGFNEDAQVAGRPVFEGMEIHVAATRPFVNYRFAQPTRTADFQHRLFYPTSAFPFAYEDQTDPFTGKTDGILHRCTASGTCPQILHTTSSTEYWQFKNSTVLTDSLGARDAEIPDNVRVYLFAGTQHVSNRALTPSGVCEQPPNLLDTRPLMRSLLVALEDWVSEGTSPPPSRHPRIDNETLVPVEDLAWPAIPDVTFAGPVLNRHRVYDYGPEFEQGIITQVLPVVTENQYRVLVPQVDEDGNEIAGIRLPGISVPTATRTGWAVWDPSGPAAGELCNQDGSFIPFPVTRADRLASGDPRPSVEERYPDHEAYVARVAEEVERLVEERLLLEEDAKRIQEEAAQSPIGAPKQ